MEEHIKKLNEKKYDDSFERTSMWLLNSQNKLLKRKSKRRILIMKEYFLKHKIQFAVVILLAILIAACNMPVTQNDTVGYLLSWTAPNSSNATVTESLNKLNWYKNSNITTDIKNGVAEYKLVLQATEEKTVMNYKNDLENIKELTSIKIIPLRESVKRPIYSAALHSFFKIDINASKMSDEQVQAEIKKQLEDAGYTDFNVSYKKDENGKTRLEMKLKEGIQSSDGKSLEVNVDDVNGHQVVKMKTGKPDVDFSKMTDEEIRAYVKEKNKKDNLSDKDITIKREGNNVSVNVEKNVDK